MGRQFLSPSLLPSATPTGQAGNAANAANAAGGSLTGSSGSKSGSRSSGNPNAQTNTPSLLEETLKELLLEESYPLDMVTDSTGTAYEGGWEGQGWEGGDADALFADFKKRNRVRVSFLYVCLCMIYPCMIYCVFYSLPFWNSRSLSSSNKTYDATYLYIHVYPLMRSCHHLNRESSSTSAASQTASGSTTKAPLWSHRHRPCHHYRQQERAWTATPTAAV